MDFAAILDQWDEKQKLEKKRQKESGKNQISSKKANAPTKEEKELLNAKKDFEKAIQLENEKKINPMEAWLRRYGTVDKDRLLEKENERTKFTDRSYIVQMKSDARIDLHGLNREEAWTRLDNFVSECEKRGLKKILIVHGKGIHTHGSDPVLGEMVRKFIEVDKRLGQSGHSETREGGKGSTWVILKNNL